MSQVTAQQILDDFKSEIEYLAGPKTAVANTPCSQEIPLEGGLAFVSDPKFLPLLIEKEIGIVVLNAKHSDQTQAFANDKSALLTSKNPKLAMAKLNAKYFPPPFAKQQFDGHRIHPTAVIASTAKIDDTAIVGPFVVIHENVSIGSHTFIGSHCVIENNTRIGNHVFVHPQVYIGHTCQIGNRVEIQPQTCIGMDGFGYAQNEKGESFKLPHYGAVVVEDDVQLGANINIDRGTFAPVVIGKGTKVDNHGHFGHNAQIGKHNLITAGFISAGSATTGSHCVFGGRVAINGHIEITDGVSVAPLSGVTGPIKKPGVYGGYPPMPYTEFRKAHASIRHLPRIRKTLAKIVKKLGLDDVGE